MRRLAQGQKGRMHYTICLNHCFYFILFDPLFNKKGPAEISESLFQGVQAKMGNLLCILLVVGEFNNSQQHHDADCCSPN